MRIKFIKIEHDFSTFRVNILFFWASQIGLDFIYFYLFDLCEDLCVEIIESNTYFAWPLSATHRIYSRFFFKEILLFERKRTNNIPTWYRIFLQSKIINTRIMEIWFDIMKVDWTEWKTLIVFHNSQLQKLFTLHKEKLCEDALETSNLSVLLFGYVFRASTGLSIIKCYR